MTSIFGWTFSKEAKLANGDDRPIVIGETLTIEPPIVPCSHGLHLSVRAIDALEYAPGPLCWRVRGSGVIVPHGDPVDKCACSERTAIAGFDATETLRAFARWCALSVIDKWDAPDAVRRYLETGDESLREAASEAAWAARDAAREAAREAAWAAWAAREAARGAAREAARDAASDAVREAMWATRDAARAARNATRKVASDAASDAARDAMWATRDAARDAAREAQNAKLEAALLAGCGLATPAPCLLLRKENHETPLG